MLVEEIKSKFDLTKKNNNYIRADASCLLDIYFGRNEIGQLVFEFRGEFESEIVKSTKVVDVIQTKRNSVRVLIFALRDISDADIFYIFCSNLMDKSKKAINDQDGYNLIVNQYAKWKSFFAQSSKKILTEQEVKGLIGELLFLTGLLKEKLGFSESLKSWTASEPTHKDFSYGEIWYEVKAIDTMRDHVSISSIEQLSGNNPGYLIVYKLEKLSPNSQGYSLNSLVDHAYGLCENQAERDLLEEKLLMAKYVKLPEYNEIYLLRSISLFNVKEGFPRLERRNVPNEVVEASYKISLPAIEKYSVGDIL